MTSKDYVQRLDWSSAIAAATLELDPNTKVTNILGQVNQTGTAQQSRKNNNDVESYLYRGIARCFIPDKEGKHKEAIDDLSKAIVHYADNQSVNNQGANINKMYYYRAYAYYLDGDYERAIADCINIDPNNPNNPNNLKNLEYLKYPCSYRDELLGKIYFAMDKYDEAVNKFAAVIASCFTQNPPIPFPPCLLDSYREACKRMNSV